MDLPHAQKAIKAAWILGVVKGIGTLCLVVYSTCIEPVYGVGFEGLVDVAIALGLSFGIYRRSRVCAVLMVCYDFFCIGAVQGEKWKGAAVSSGYLVALLYFFF
jgi:serine/threonine-protein kinase